MDRRKFLIGAASIACASQVVPVQAMMIEIDVMQPYPSRESAMHRIQVMKRHVFNGLSKTIGFDKTKLILDDICMKTVRVKPPFILSSDAGKITYHGLAYHPDILPKNSFLCDHIEFDEEMITSLGYTKNDQRHFYTPIPFNDMGI